MNTRLWQEKFNEACSPDARELLSSLAPEVKKSVIYALRLALPAHPKTAADIWTSLEREVEALYAATPPEIAAKCEYLDGPPIPIGWLFNKDN